MVASASDAPAMPPPAVPGSGPGGGAPLRFDPNTGQPLGDDGKPAVRTMFFGALQQQAVTPRLVVIKGEGGDGVTYHLSGTTHNVGRSKGDITFAEDVFLSPEHARFTVQDGRLFVQDLSNNNGVFVRIKRPMPLDHGDSFLLGEQLLEIDSAPLPDYVPNAQGTYFYGSPRPTGAFRVMQQLAGGGRGLIRSANGNTLAMGREGNDLDFPDDRFISGHHAKLDLSDDAKVLLTDTGSRNGTFIRIKGAQELFHGDYLFVGQQLFRVEIS
ncbi:MAG: FHA domain-containing protein [Myxococcales bacterium]|nr:FHA domain-containing protein [Myxococcales bacterium]